MKIQIKSRLLATVQSKGNLGKSTECLARIEWLKNLSVEWQAYDLDDAHRSVFKRYPERTKLIPVSGPESAEQLLRVFRNAGKTPVQIVDARAQATDEILRVIQRTQFLSIAADQGIRMTVFVFPYDDLATMQNLEGVVRELGNAVDYMVVRNPAKNPTRMFDGSGLQSIIKEWGGAEITMPAMFKSTLLQLDELEARHERGITWAEAIGKPLRQSSVQWPYAGAHSTPALRHAPLRRRPPLPSACSVPLRLRAGVQCSSDNGISLDTDAKPTPKRRKSLALPRSEGRATP